MTEQQSAPPQGAAASLLNGLAVLEAFSTARPVLGVTEISERVGLHKSTVSRMLGGLVDAGYVQRDEATGRFRLGLGLLTLAGPLLADLDVGSAALPHLESLSAQTGETAAISVWNGTCAVVVEQVASPHQVKHSATIGTRYDRLASSSVRVFLADLGPAEVQRLIEGQSILTEDAAGIDTPVAEQLERVRQDGFAVNDGRTTYEEYGVSTGVRDYRGRLVGCITLSAPRSRVQQQRNREELILLVREAAAKVSARLGGRGDDAA